MDTANDTRDIVNKKKAERPSSDKEPKPKTCDGKMVNLMAGVLVNASIEATAPATDAMIANACAMGMLIRLLL